jgi:anti-sigma regulatory factor (Ser/Thr protein kinase)
MSLDAAESGDVVELELPARPEVVSVARLIIGALVAADPLFDEERSADLRLAVSEACTNAIQAEMAGHPDRAPDPEAEPIVMRCTLGDGHIEVAITDHGGGFDPEGLEAHPDVTSPDRLNYEGGLGIPLIKMLADRLEFRPTPDGTTVVMEFEPRDPGAHPVIETVNGSGFAPGEG